MTMSLSPFESASADQEAAASTSQNLTSTCWQAYFMLQVLGVMGAELE